MKYISTFIIIALLMTTICCFPASAAPEVEVPCALLMDQATGTVLFEKNADEKRAPASVTKVMTMLLIMEALDQGRLRFEDPIAVSANAAGMGGSQVYLKEGETMTAQEMLKCIAVVSANDCCVAMAEHLNGSVEDFIAAMNEKAKALGMTNTHFNSCTGLDTEDHYTTARDIALMSRELMQHEEIKKYTTIWMDTVRDGAFTLSNTNRLVRYYEGATGLKTGFTNTAGYCLSATAERDGMALCAVVLGGETSDQRFENAKALLNYGFSQYSIYKEPLPAPAAVKVIKGLEDSVIPVPAKAPAFLIPKGKEATIDYKVNLQNSVAAPIDKGQRLGTVTYTLGEQTLGTIDLIAEKAIGKVTFSHLFFHIIQYFFVV